jgi:ubiquinone/menaquinone biosynthesis C-methylase UbiE
VAEATSREVCLARHREYKNDTAKRINELQRTRIRAMLRPVRPGESVLDIGCNAGHLVDFLPRCAVYGVDCAPELVALAALRMRGAWVEEAEALTFPDQSFTCTVLGEILEHVHDPVVVLSEARRVCARHVVGSTPHPEGKWGTATVATHPHHVRCYTSRQLRQDLTSAGLTPLHLEVVHDAAGVPQFWVFEAQR